MLNAVYYHQGYAFIYISATKPTRHRSLWERLSIQQWLQEVIYPGVHFNRSTKIMASVSHHIQGFVWNAIIGPYSDFNGGLDRLCLSEGMSELLHLSFSYVHNYHLFNL